MILVSVIPTSLFLVVETYVTTRVAHPTGFAYIRNGF